VAALSLCAPVACSSPEPQVQPKTVYVPVPAPAQQPSLVEQRMQEERIADEVAREICRSNGGLYSSFTDTCR
jgi:hypothetical protein